MGYLFWCQCGWGTWLILSFPHCSLHPTAEHFGQFDQTIFTREEKNVTFIVIQIRIRWTETGRKVGGSFLVWWGYLIDFVYPLVIAFYVLPRNILDNLIRRFSPQKGSVAFIVNLGQIRIRWTGACWDVFWCGWYTWLILFIPNCPFTFYHVCCPLSPFGGFRYSTAIDWVVFKHLLRSVALI